MAELTLIRHSLPEIDPEVPSALWHLSEEGRRRCRTLADVLTDKARVDLIVSSPEPKARETAEIIADQLGKPVSIVDDLREHERSRTGLLPGDEFEAAVARLFAEPDSLVFGEETADQAHDRFGRAIARLAADHPDRNIVAVTHGTVMSLYLSRMLGCDPFVLWQSMSLPGFVTLSVPTHEVLRWEL